jgi:hypothetical protein
MSGGVPVPVEDEIARIETTIRDDSPAYWRDPDMRRRYGELLEARSARVGTARPRRPDAVAAEIADIEKRMRDDFAAYRADPELQARYGALLEVREGRRPVVDSLPSSPGRGGSPPAVIEALGSTESVFNRMQADGQNAALAALSGGGAGEFDGNLRAVQMLAVDIARDLNDADAAERFSEAFSRLPDRVQAAAFQELLRDGGAYPAASDADLATFRVEDDAAETLLAEWGPDAAARLGVARGRLGAIAKGLDVQDRSRLDHFVTAAPAGDWAAILRHLADPSAARNRPAYRSLRRQAA